MRRETLLRITAIGAIDNHWKSLGRLLLTFGKLVNRAMAADLQRDCGQNAVFILAELDGQKCSRRTRRQNPRPAAASLDKNFDFLRSVYVLFARCSIVRSKSSQRELSQGQRRSQHKQSRAVDADDSQFRRLPIVKTQAMGLRRLKRHRRIPPVTHNKLPRHPEHNSVDDQQDHNSFTNRNSRSSKNPS